MNISNWIVNHEHVVLFVLKIFSVGALVHFILGDEGVLQEGLFVDWRGVFDTHDERAHIVVWKLSDDTVTVFIKAIDARSNERLFALARFDQVNHLTELHTGFPTMALIVSLPRSSATLRR